MAANENSTSDKQIIANLRNQVTQLKKELSKKSNEASRLKTELSTLTQEKNDSFYELKEDIESLRAAFERHRSVEKKLLGLIGNLKGEASANSKAIQQISNRNQDIEDKTDTIIDLLEREASPHSEERNTDDTWDIDYRGDDFSWSDEEEYAQQSALDQYWGDTD